MRPANRRWFTKQLGRRITSELARQIAAWLVEEFGFVVPRDDDVAEFSADWSTFYAERYGDDGLTPQGGGGRVGVRRNFQVKGIGITPLVGRDADWLHQHGCVWMEEAVREAILSEVVAREFPFGAVPVIAIIDTGLDAAFAVDSIDHRRVLLVRPSFARPAHMQRAPLFFPQDGTVFEAQIADGRRAKQVITHLAADPKVLVEMFLRAAQQLAFAYVHRFYLGGMLSSNWAVDGSLVDFGGVSSVPDWSRRVITPGLPLFGSEHLSVETTIEYVVHRAKRFNSTWGEVDASTVIEQFKSCLCSATRAEFERLRLHVQRTSAELRQSIGSKVAPFRIDATGGGKSDPPLP